MLMVLLALGSVVVCAFALVALVVMGGPGMWVATMGLAIYLGRRAWRWLEEPMPASVDTVLPPRRQENSRDMP